MSAREQQRISKGSGSRRWPLSFKTNQTTKTGEEGDVPGLVELSSSVQRPFLSPKSSSSRGPLAFRKKPSTSPSLESSEVSCETERSLDCDISLTKPNESGSSPPTDCVATTLRKAAGRWVRVRNLLQSISLPASPLICAAVTGLVLPRMWIFYTFLWMLFRAIHIVVVKWVLYVWKDRELVHFRRTILHSFKLLEKELELTVHGNYSRQVMASFAFYAATAPGESSIGLFLRRTTNAINMRTIQDLSSAKSRFSRAQDHFYGYTKAAKVYAPFS